VAHGFDDPRTNIEL